MVIFPDGHVYYARLYYAYQCESNVLIDNRLWQMRNMQVIKYNPQDYEKCYCDEKFHYDLTVE